MIWTSAKALILSSKRKVLLLEIYDTGVWESMVAQGAEREGGAFLSSLFQEKRPQSCWNRKALK